MNFLKFFLVFLTLCFCSSTNATSDQKFDFLLRLKRTDYQLDLSKNKNLDFELFSLRYINQAPSLIKANLYEIKNGEKVFVSSVNSKLSPKSKKVFLSLSPGYFETTEKDLSLEIMDERSRLLKTLDFTVQASNLHEQLVSDSSLVNKLESNSDQILEDILANKLSFEMRRQRNSNVTVTRNENNTYKISFPLLSVKNRTPVISPALITAQNEEIIDQKIQNTISYFFEKQEQNDLASGRKFVTSGASGFSDVIVPVSLVSGQAEIAKLVQGGTINNSSIDNAIINNSRLNNISIQGISINGDLAVAGNVFANTFIGNRFIGGTFTGIFNGDASQLKNIPASRIIGAIPTTVTNLTNLIINKNTVNGNLSFNKNGSISAPNSTISAKIFNGQSFIGGTFNGDASKLKNIPADQLVGNLRGGLLLNGDGLVINGDLVANNIMLSGNITAQNLIGTLFGNWKPIKIGSVYQAPSDGFVNLAIDGIYAKLTQATLLGYTDGNSSPNTVRAVTNWHYNDATNIAGRSGRYYVTALMPVKKGDYFRVVETNSSGSLNKKAEWLAIGGGADPNLQPGASDNVSCAADGYYHLDESSVRDGNLKESYGSGPGTLDFTKCGRIMFRETGHSVTNTWSLIDPPRSGELIFYVKRRRSSRPQGVRYWFDNTKVSGIPQPYDIEEWNADIVFTCSYNANTHRYTCIVSKMVLM